MPAALCETPAWDCPECGRIGNTGNYCGGCAHPAPWLENETDKSHDFKSIGNTVSFGHYEQDNNMENGMETIEWIVMDYDEGNNKALLLSKYGLDAVPYNKTPTAITWEQCTLRAWLNGEFLNKAFNAKEQSAILVTDVDNNSSYNTWHMGGGNNTKDQIFLLNDAEANRYLSVTTNSENTKSRVAPTAYADARGANTRMGMAWWWLRSPGDSQDRAAYVRYDGSLSCNSVSSDFSVVRPAFWVDLESDLFGS